MVLHVVCISDFPFGREMVGVVNQSSWPVRTDVTFILKAMGERVEGRRFVRTALMEKPSSFWR